MCTAPRHTHTNSDGRDGHLVYVVTCHLRGMCEWPVCFGHVVCVRTAVSHLTVGQVDPALQVGFEGFLLTCCVFSSAMYVQVSAGKVG